MVQQTCGQDVLDNLCDFIMSGTQHFVEDFYEPDVFNGSLDALDGLGLIFDDDNAYLSAPDYLEPMIEQPPAPDADRARTLAPFDAEHELKFMQLANDAAAPPQPKGALSYECSLQREQCVYSFYAEYSHVYIKLKGFACKVGAVTIHVGGAHYRGGSIANEQTLRWTRRGSPELVMDDSSDAVMFKVPSASSRKVSSVENHGDGVFIDLMLDRSRIKLFTNEDRKRCASLDNTFSITVSCELSDGTSTMTVIEPKMRVLSKQGPKKRMRDLPDTFTRNYKSAKDTFARSYKSAKTSIEGASASARE